MLVDICLTPEELRQFLDEQLDPGRQAAIGTHVNRCRTCQATLDELTQSDAYELCGLSTELPAKSLGSGAEAEATTHHVRGGDGAEEPLIPDTGSRLSFQVDGGSTLDHDGTPPDIPAGATRVPPGAADRDEPDGPVPVAGSSTSDSRPGLPQIPSYDLLEPLGEGGMGVVYKARQRGLNRLVAVKMIRGDGQDRPDNLARFRIEAEAVARLHHPNILQIFEIGETGGVPFVSLELLEGGSLDLRLAGTPQPGRQAAELLITLAGAVQVAHDAGIIHRDLKPSNILFTGDGIPKITDFGLAKRLEADSRQTESGQIMGSPSYMAPEQASGHTRDVEPAADIYALGAILYEMLTGRPPFKGETPIETVRMVIDHDPVPPSTLVPRIERDLETICLKCLAKEPPKRYGSAAALAADLERYRNGETIEARRTPVWERGIKWSRRHPLRATLLVLGAVALAGAFYAGVGESRRIATVMTTSNDEIFRAQEELGQNRLNEALTRLRVLRSRIEAETEQRLRELHDRAGGLLDQIDRRMADDLARDGDRARYQEFARNSNEALFYETQFTGLDQATSRKATEQAARAALAVFAPSGSGERWSLGPLPESLSAKKEEVREGCYTMLLVLAEAVERPEQGLRARRRGKLAAPHAGLPPRARRLPDPVR